MISALFRRLFGQQEGKADQPDIKFGRFCDTYRNDRQLKSWENAIEKFESNEYFLSLAHLLDFLHNEDEQNVSYEHGEDHLDFTIVQGSKLIVGYSDGEHIRAEAKIAKAEKLNVGFLRKLVEKNYALNFARFALDADNVITIVFDSSVVTGSPYKLYQAFQELAINADKQDDLLVNEFKELQPINTGHIDLLEENEMKVRHDFLIEKIHSILKLTEEGKLKADKFPGGISYLLLDTLYKLDYLVKPEGQVMDILEKGHQHFFDENDKSTARKNLELQKQLRKILELDRSEIFKELYGVSCSFSVTREVDSQRIFEIIDGELPNMDWYMDNKYKMTALSIPGYIAGYCLFNYSLPIPLKSMFHLYFMIMEQPFFKKIGFDINFISESDEFQKREINDALDRIVSNHCEKYPKLKPDTSILRYDDRPTFAKTWFSMIRKTDFSMKST